MRKPDVTTYHGFNARSVLEGRYPFADFSEYFRYLKACAAERSKPHRQFLDPKRKYSHHICPRAQFPEFAGEPDNQIKITVEQHIHAHDLLSIAAPELYVAPSFIAACIRLKSAHQRKALLAAIRKNPDHQRHAGRCAAAVNKMNGTLRAAQRKRSSAGGKVAGRRAVKSGQLARLRTPKHQSAAGRAANHKRWHVKRSAVNPKCELCKESSQ
jgi:hypothetical protein